MPELQQPIHSLNVKTKGKTYFFDLKVTKNGGKYMSISESWMKEGQKHRSTITVFPDNFQAFAQTFSEMQSKVA
jgi:Protein of unknown function (DUF3276)